jgi:hypothetical protein
MKKRCDGCDRSVNEAQLKPREVVIHLHLANGEEIIFEEIELLCERCQREADEAPVRPDGRLTDEELRELWRYHDFTSRSP